LREVKRWARVFSVGLIKYSSSANTNSGCKSIKLAERG
jgi:hypothetical protein